MPGFVKTPKDEARWAKAKEAAGKQTEKDSESYWKLANYIFHKMGKTEEDVQKAEALEKQFGGMLQMSMKTSIPNPSKVGSVAVKMPKAKKPASPFAKPSLFFKTEDFEGIKHPSVEKLRAFLEKTRVKK
jgi:hypothetical protein